jgi:hypothetical protein
MDQDRPTIVIIEQRIERKELARLVAAHFGDMVKIVVDVRREVVAVGGELHADAEELLLEHGSRQAHLWGANYYPGRGAEDCLEYTALINIRPSQDNPSMEIQDTETRTKVRSIAERLVGRGEEL